ncbi:WD40 repeat domain-containing protein [Nonomuraea rubra]
MCRSAWLWSAESEPHRALTAHTEGVSALAIAPGGTWCATAARGEVRVWNADGTPCLDLDYRDVAIGTLIIAPDGTWLAASGRGGVQVWDANGDRRSSFAGESR